MQCHGTGTGGRIGCHVSVDVNWGPATEARGKDIVTAAHGHRATEGTRRRRRRGVPGPGPLLELHVAPSRDVS